MILPRVHWLGPLFLIATACCDRKETTQSDPAGNADSRIVERVSIPAAGVELCRVPGVSIQRLEPAPSASTTTPSRLGHRITWGENGLLGEPTELDQIVAFVLPPDTWMAPSPLPEGRYRVRVDAPYTDDRTAGRDKLFGALSDTFHVQISIGVEEMDGYELRAIAGQTPNLPESNLNEKWGNDGKKLTAMPIPDFADWAGNELGKPVVDRTGLPGTYTFELHWSFFNPPTLLSAVQPFGLEFVPVKVHQQSVKIVKLRSTEL